MSFAERYLADDYPERCGLPRSPALEELRRQRAGWLDKPSTLKMSNPIMALPERPAHLRVYNEPAVTLGADLEWSDAEKLSLRDALESLMPWRKGPFRFFGLDVDAEWQSDRKWRRVLDALPGSFADARILDIGCNNGYYMRRLLAEGPRFVLGIDPRARYWFYHLLFERLAPERQLGFDLLGVEDVGCFPGSFDVALLMGIIYHRRDPMGCLAEIAGALKPGGLLVVESAGIPGTDDVCLFPRERYMKAKGYWFLPTVSALEAMVRRSGFDDVKVFCTHPLTTDEQRPTPWAVFESLEHFLDQKDPTRTVEGYPAPIRIYLHARKRRKNP